MEECAPLRGLSAKHLNCHEPSLNSQRVFRLHVRRGSHLHLGYHRLFQTLTSYEKTSKSSKSRQENRQATGKRYALVPWHSNGAHPEEEVSAEFSTIEAVTMSIAAVALLVYGVWIIYKDKV